MGSRASGSTPNLAPPSLHLSRRKTTSNRNPTLNLNPKPQTLNPATTPKPSNPPQKKTKPYEDPPPPQKKKKEKKKTLAPIKIPKLWPQTPIKPLTTPIKPLTSAEAQLSQAPPELDMEMASCTEEPREPVRSPKTASGSGFWWLFSGLGFRV